MRRSRSASPSELSTRREVGSSDDRVIRSDMIDNGSFPGWRFAIEFTHENKQQAAGVTLMALLKAGDRLGLMLNRGISGNKRSETFMGKWDLASRTLSLSDKGVAERAARLRAAVAKGNKGQGSLKSQRPNPTRAAEEVKFKIVFGTDGSMTYSETSTTADAEAVTINVSTTYRIKTPLEPFLPPKPDTNRLPNGYGVFVASRSEILLEDETGDIILGANIAQIGNDGDLIFGKIVPYGGLGRETTGYFVLNSGKGDRNLMKGLSEVEWIKELRKRGLKKAPVLIDSEQKRPRADWGEN